MNLKESIRRIIREDRYKGYKRFLKDNVFTDFPEYIINDMFRESGDLDYSQVQGMTKDQIIDYFFNGDGKRHFDRWGEYKGKKQKVVKIEWDDLTEPLQIFLKNKMSGKNPNLSDTRKKIDKMIEMEPNLGNGNNEPIQLKYNEKGKIEDITGGNHRTYAAFEINDFNPILMNAYIDDSKTTLQETIKRILKEEFLNESDPKTGTGKKPKGSDRRLYTDENPSDTVSVKFKTKEDIVDTLNKESFKSKPHKRQSQIINLIHQRVRAAYQNAKDPETKKRLKTAYDYIETVKEKSKQKTIRLQKQKVNESKTIDYNELIYNILERFKEEDCICDTRVSFDVEENYYNVYLVFSQEELHDKFSNVMWIRNYITEMMNDVKNDLEAFLPIRNIFIGYYTKPNCEWSPLNESEDDKEKKIQKNLRAIRILLDTIDVDGLCEMWVEYNPEDGDYEIRSKTTVRYYDMEDMAEELEYIEDTIRSWKLKTYVFSPYYVEQCEDEIEFLNESENKKPGLLRAIEEDGLYQVMQDTGLSIRQIILKYDNLPREVFVRFIKDYIHEDGYHQTDGAVQMPYEVEISHNIFVTHFYMKGDKVTVEIRGYNDYNEQTDGYIESLSNLTDEEIFSIVDIMTRNIEDNWD